MRSGRREGGAVGVLCGAGAEEVVDVLDADEPEQAGGERAEHQQDGGGAGGVLSGGGARGGGLLDGAIAEAGHRVGRQAHRDSSILRVKGCSRRTGFGIEASIAGGAWAISVAKRRFRRLRWFGLGWARCAGADGLDRRGAPARVADGLESIAAMAFEFAAQAAQLFHVRNGLAAPPAGRVAAPSAGTRPSAPARAPGMV